MELKETFLLIENHWLSIVITAWVIYFMFKIANLFYLKLERKIINEHSKDLKNKFPETIKKNTHISQLLYKTLYQTWWDRAYIFEYHNWWHSISWIDFLKCSNTFEVVNDWVNPQQLVMQNIPIWFFWFWNQKILEKSKIIFQNIEDLKISDNSIYQNLKQQNIKSIYILWLYDSQWNPIGFFWLEFLKKQAEKEKINISDLEILSYKIAWLLY